ncbi:signal recognition particle [candidate division TA06 bacterium SM1_40]|uniref:Signal recognition particle protein n=2 Tax=Bacteria division TA06 TaxID=1156500 RepID=A0A0S8JHQ4_UNCT6|nr:MAG: signal recognition particle [candidate division TA06 bacterium SM23_40]KPL09334.1 MAG: signal recognition particle [candidate division TA06 bacterium SM1_40]
MFDDLTEKLGDVFRRLRGYGRLSEKDVRAAMREIRIALLEADVNYRVVKDFIDSVQSEAVGERVTKSVSPGYQVIKIVHDELVSLLGGEGERIGFAASPPTVIMLVGLQGCGKTTLAAKLAHRLKKAGKRPLLVACDTRRPAAREQLAIVADQVPAPVFFGDGTDAVEVAASAVKGAREQGRDLLILDTGGRLHIDDELMDELARMKDAVHPTEICLVADGMTGQDAVQVAKEFDDRLGIDGVILTKLDGDARGGAALSIRAVTGRPIKFVGVGEKVGDLEEFIPERMASRILGLGDVVSLVEKAEAVIDQKEAERLEAKLRKEEFTLDDFLDQLRQMRRIAPLDQVLQMVPGVDRKMLKSAVVDEAALDRFEAIVCSMTREERRRPEILDGSRRKRIAKGSGTTLHDVNNVVKQFMMARKLMKDVTTGKLKVPGLPEFRR